QQFETARRRLPGIALAPDQPQLLGLRQPGSQPAGLKPGVLTEIGGTAAFHQARAIEHVLEDPLLRRHLALLDDGGGMTGALQVVLRVPATGAAQDAAVGERQLAVGARADAEVIAIGPVVEIVPAAPSRPGEGGNLVALEAGL